MKEEFSRDKSNGQEMDRPGKIIVTGIPKDKVYSEVDLEKEFSVFGRITEAYIVRDRRDKSNHKSRGFAFITYENPKDAADAMKAMEGKDLGGERKIHCEQAVVVPRKSDDYHEDGPRGRGSERGRGRGEGRGRGMDRGGWRGGDRGMRGGRGGGRGMEWGEYRGDPRGGRGFRGGMMRGRGEGMGMRGRGRGDYFEPDMHGDDFYDHGPHGPSDMPRGRPGRRTLLPNPNFRGGRGQGPPPGPPHRGRGGPPGMRGRNDYYDEGPDGYYDHGEVRGSYNEGYEEGYQEEEYYDRQPYPERMPPHGGPGGGRGARPFRGRGMPPREGMGMSREEVEYQHRGEEYTVRRGGDYGGRGSGPMRRGGPGPAPGGRAREGNPPEEYLPPKRQMVDDYGYADEGPDMRRKEAPRRAPPGQIPDDDYDYESYARRSDYYDSAPRGRGASGGRGARAPPPSGRGSSGQRRAPLLGHDPYKADDGGPDYYQAPPAQSQAGPDPYEGDDYSRPRGGVQTPARRRPLGGDESYGYDAVPAKTSQLHDDGYSQTRGIAGPGMYDQSYQEEPLDSGRRRDDYDNVRQSGMRRSEMDYASPADDYLRQGSDMYASYTPRSRGDLEARDVESDPYSRKRHLDYGEDVHRTEMPEVGRDYQDFHDRPASMSSGPSSSKRERYDGFYQSRQEEVYREL